VKVYDLPVEDVMEKLPTVTVEDSLDSVLEQLKKYEAVLVSSPRDLQAVATATDVLNYLSTIARPFVFPSHRLLRFRFSYRASFSLTSFFGTANSRRASC
jgi:hypothetical protein